MKVKGNNRLWPCLSKWFSPCCRQLWTLLNCVCRRADRLFILYNSHSSFKMFFYQTVGLCSGRTLNWVQEVCQMDLRYEVLGQRFGLVVGAKQEVALNPGTLCRTKWTSPSPLSVGGRGLGSVQDSSAYPAWVLALTYMRRHPGQQPLGYPIHADMWVTLEGRLSFKASTRNSGTGSRSLLGDHGR